MVLANDDRVLVPSRTDAADRWWRIVPSTVDGWRTRCRRTTPAFFSSTAAVLVLLAQCTPLKPSPGICGLVGNRSRRDDRSGSPLRCSRAEAPKAPTLETTPWPTRGLAPALPLTRQAGSTTGGQAPRDGSQSGFTGNR